ncbi:PREDICTED: ubiquinone biosynthesis O-methyltransferase, mitochondrial-like [Cyphomyrmex costatus]|nr:PREDICTED: ubiquinone biosynthesis O-methyltransferase, mitochondrial-like [Cyphomyrmex costatus]
MIVLNIVKYLNGSWRNIPPNRLLGNVIYFNRSISTMDPKKIEHFASMKNFWWDENGPVKGLHTYNLFKLQFVKDGLINAKVQIQNSDLPLKEIKIVDIGCGGGIVTEGLAKTGAQVTGIDVCAELIDIAKEHVKMDPHISKRVNYIHTTVEDFVQKKEDSTYDAVIVFDVLQYVTNPQLFLKECVEIIKPGKSIFITTINKTLTSWLSNILAVEYIFRCIPCGTFEWYKFVEPHKVQSILKNYDCETISMCGIKFNPITKRWFRSSSVSTFYMLHAVKQEKIGI